MARTQKTRDLVRQKSKYRRYEKKLRILSALAKAGKPQTMGQLFLSTSLTYSPLITMLRELKEDGLVYSRFGTIYYITRYGSEVKYEGTRWYLKKEAKNGQVQ